MKYRLLFLIAILQLVVAPVFAKSELEKTKVNWSGYLTLGLSQADKYDDLIYRRSSTQEIDEIEAKPWLLDTRLGLQSAIEFNANWDAVVQVLAKERAEQSLNSMTEMAFLRYRSADELSVVIGRSPLKFYLLTEYRDVGYSYHWVRPPVEFYGWIPLYNMDGVSISKSWGDWESSFSVELFAGRSETEFELIYGDPDNSDLETSPISGLGISWQGSELLLRAYYTVGKFPADSFGTNPLLENIPTVAPLWPDYEAIAHSQTDRDTKMKYAAVSLSWEPKSWIVQSEFSVLNPEDGVSYDGNRGYFSLGRRFGKFLPHFTYSFAKDDRSNPYSPPPAGLGMEGLYDLVTTSLYVVTMNQSTTSLGLRWDLQKNKALKFQCDRSKIGDNSLGLHTGPVPRFSEDDRSWCSVTFDWIF